WELHGNEIHQKPHPNVTKLRGEKLVDREQVTVSPDKENFVDARGHQLEIIAEINPQESKKFGFTVAKNPEGTEQTRIYYDVESQEFVVDATQTSDYELDSETEKDGALHTSEVNDYSQTGDYKLKNEESVKIRLFIDGSVIEVYIDDKDAFTTTILPSDEESTIVDLFSAGGAATFNNVQIF